MLSGAVADDADADAAQPLTTKNIGLSSCDASRRSNAERNHGNLSDCR